MEHNDAADHVETGFVGSPKHLDWIVDIHVRAGLLGRGDWCAEGNLAALILDVDLNRIHSELRVGKCHDRLEHGRLGDAVARNMDTANVIRHGDTPTNGLFGRRLFRQSLGHGGSLLGRLAAATPREGERCDCDGQQQNRD